jgi:hypothetical protein
MRLRLFDRIRRLTHRRRPSMQPDSEFSGGAQGRHRRGRGESTQRRESPGPPSAVALSRRGSSGPAEWSAPPTSAPPSRSASGGPSLAGPGGFPPSGASLASGPAAVPGHRSRTAPDAGSRRASRISGSPAVGAGAARARIREAPADAAPVGVDEAARSAPAGPYAPRPHWYEAARPGPSQAARAGQADTRAADVARVAAGVPRQHGGGRSWMRAAGAAMATPLPFAAPHTREQPLTADGRRNCGSIEQILWRQWDTAAPPPAEVIEAVDRLAELPEAIKERLADGLDAIFIGPGGVPELDDMTALRGVPLPAGRATWDACAGAYGERKIVVGSQPSPTPDVMCHEVGHALDDLDSPPGKWQSDSAEFRMLYDQCQPHLASDFHRQPGGLGRKEFFADAFAAIASRQRPALVDMLSGDTRTALRVMLYFNRRYGI